MQTRTPGGRVRIAGPMQRRLDFTPTVRTIEVDIYPAGSSIAVYCDETVTSELAGHLQQAGAGARPHPVHGHVIPSSMLYRLAELPGNIHVTSDLELEPVWQLAEAHSHGKLDSPALLTLNGGRLHLTWEGADGETIGGTLTADATAALMSANLPFIATGEAWQEAVTRSPVPVTAGAAAVDPKGYIRIRATHPHQIEAAPIPGLWRIDQRHYGAPLPHLSRTAEVRGIIWAGGRPPGPARTPGDAEGRIVRLLDSCGTAVLTWPAGTGRMRTVLKVLKTQNLIPVVIAAPAENLVAWKLAADETGVPLEHIHLVDHRLLADGHQPPATSAVVIDQFTRLVGSDHASKLAGDGETTVTVGLTTEWPSEPAQRCAALHLLRPWEFSAEATRVLIAHPTWPEVRASEHAEAYLVPPPPLTAGAARLDVVTVPADRQQTIETADAAGRGVGSLPMLRQTADLGAGGRTSPKLAVTHTRAAASAATIVTGSSRVRSILGRTAGAAGCPVVTWDQVAAELASEPGMEPGVGGGAGPFVAGRNLVVHDLPEQHGLLEKAAAAARSTLVIHLTGSIDDIIAEALAEDAGRPGCSLQDMITDTMLLRLTGLEPSEPEDLTFDI